jgi:hypothetical protein
MGDMPASGGVVAERLVLPIHGFDGLWCRLPDAHVLGILRAATLK